MATTHPALSTISKTFQIALIGLMLTLTTGSLFAQNSVLTLYHSTEEVQGGRLTLPVEGLAPGIYLLRIEHQHVWTTRKVVIR